MSFVNLLNILYPVGSIYITTNSTSPSQLIGGSWNKVEDKFLLGSGVDFALGATGGEQEHSLTYEEMPSYFYVWYSSDHGDSGLASLTNNAIWSYGLKQQSLPLQLDKAGKAHNNMPPYLAVNIWIRVS